MTMKGEALKEFRENRVSVIVLLVEDVECLQKAKRNLYDLYLEQGFRVIHLPIADFSIPSDGRTHARCEPDDRVCQDRPKRCDPLLRRDWENRHVCCLYGEKVI